MPVRSGGGGGVDDSLGRREVGLANGEGDDVLPLLPQLDCLVRDGGRGRRLHRGHALADAIEVVRHRFGRVCALVQVGPALGDVKWI
eukprot:COSAG06_NODE_5595_length_3374_cov_2.819542_3_plen_87_part_00